jgi:hypothetical protein
VNPISDSSSAAGNIEIMGKRAADRLASVEFFSLGPAGPEGDASSWEIQFRRVLEGADAQTGFLRLLESGTSAAKCYALIGLKCLDAKLFEEQAKRYLEDRTVVEVAVACMAHSSTVAQMVQRIGDGDYDDLARGTLPW